MNVAVKILLYVAMVVVAGCLLAPVLWWAGQWAVDADLIPQLKRVKFPRYFNRAMMAVLLLSLWPFLRWAGLQRWTDLGLKPNPHRWRDLALGAAIGAIGLFLVAGILVAWDQAYVRTPIRWGRLGPILLTAAVVPIIEEIFFRGVLFGLLRRALSWRVALAFISFFFAVVHFIKPLRKAGRILEVHWYSGFELLPRLFWQFSRPELVLAGWVTLFLVGWILGYTVFKTRSLYLAIGLHGGWVFALRSFARLAKRTYEPSLWIGKDLTVGFLPIGFLLLSLALLYLWFRRTADGVAVNRGA